MVVGYRRERKTFKLTFDQTTEFAGLEVRAYGVNLGTLLKLASLVNQETLTAEDLDELLTGFSQSLIEWNLEQEDGTPVPATKEGMYAYEHDLILAVCRYWINKMQSVDADLGKESKSGEPPMEESMIPMEPLSESRAS